MASDLRGDRGARALRRIDADSLRGAALAIGVVLCAPDAAQMDRSGDAITKLSVTWLGLDSQLDRHRCLGAGGGG